MYNGILPIYKERGMTSHDVVFKARKILQMKKIGHAGTLDPEVGGVLLLLLGGATKVSDYAMNLGKSTNNNGRFNRWNCKRAEGNRCKYSGH